MTVEGDGSGRNRRGSSEAATPIDGRGLSYQVHDGRGPYALFVHGMLSTRSTWSPNLGALADVCTPVVVELWGHGLAPSPTEPDVYRPDGYVEQFEALRRRLGVDRWMLCGQSLGGALLLRYALEHPDAVAAVAFTNAMSALSDAAWAVRVAELVEKEAAALEAGGRARLERNAMHPRRSTKIAPDVKEQLVAEWAEHDPVGIARTMRWTSQGTSVLDRLGQLQPPALLVQGVREKQFRPLADAARVALPTLESVGVEAGHAVNLHDPSGFNAAVAEFFVRADR
jgi:pimeloyl-ACP methyl ester carboxylesterase